MSSRTWSTRAGVRRSRRAGGDYGVVQTLRKMGEHIRAASVAPPIVELARQIIMPAGRRQVTEKIGLIRAWVDGHTRWVPDPLEAEYLVPPLELLGRMRTAGVAVGDCDDIAMLAAALLRAVGIRARLRAVAFVPFTQFRHVYAEGWDGSSWRELDTSRPARGARLHSRALTMGV